MLVAFTELEILTPASEKNLLNSFAILVWSVTSELLHFSLVYYGEKTFTKTHETIYLVLVAKRDAPAGEITCPPVN
jgi:hypothetical protein